MANPSTNIRLDPQLKQSVLQRAEEEGLSLAEVAKFLFRAYAARKISIDVIEQTPEYSSKVVDMILKETATMEKQRRAGTLKGYASGKSMLHDILGK